MAVTHFCQRHLALILLSFTAICSFSDCFDPLDPNGNITVTFDIHKWTPDGYLARATIQNFYLYRRVDKPGWTMGWTWANREVIWSMSGAFATQQGNCSSFKSDIPHSCKKDPVIVDLMPDAPAENKSENCCRGGLLSVSAIDPSNSFASFEMKIGGLGGNTPVPPPLNLTLMAPGPGYTCSLLVDVDPTESSVIGGRRKIQVFRTWKSTCTYSSYLANKTPVCCVSLSAFYNPTVTSCANCSCGCREADPTATSCISKGTDNDIVQCTDHMCPLRIHWHVKNIYTTYWRAKLTISNYNYNRNYSDWNVLVQHPGFRQNSTIFSFNSTVLPTVGFADEVALFWGISNYNTELLQAGEYQIGSVSTEILFTKDSQSFTLRNGWALPRRIYFNGEDCKMPLPDIFPMLPNGSSRKKPTPWKWHVPILLIIYLTFETLVNWL